jgi:hypothetical protein
MELGNTMYGNSKKREIEVIALLIKILALKWLMW